MLFIFFVLAELLVLPLLYAHPPGDPYVNPSHLKDDQTDSLASNNSSLSFLAIRPFLSFLFKLSKERSVKVLPSAASSSECGVSNLFTKNCWPEIAWKKWLIIGAVVLLTIFCLSGCIGCAYYVFQMWLMKRIMFGVADKLTAEKNATTDKTATTDRTVSKDRLNPV